MNMPDDFARDVEAAADEYARQHHHAPVTEERAAQYWDEAPAGYVGRRRANEDGTPALDHIETVADVLGEYRCLWPDRHAIEQRDEDGGPVAWIQHRKATGECLRCGGTVPR